MACTSPHFSIISLLIIFSNKLSKDFHPMDHNIPFPAPYHHFTVLLTCPGKKLHFCQMGARLSEHKLRFVPEHYPDFKCPWRCCRYFVFNLYGLFFACRETTDRRPCVRSCALLYLFYFVDFYHLYDDLALVFCDRLSESAAVFIPKTIRWKCFNLRNI